jgi:hypothetical protein
MPDQRFHTRQAEHNQRLADSLDRAKYPDWAVTALFYCALHHLDAYLARWGLGHPSTHQARHDAWHRSPAFRADLWSYYRELSERSKVTRYENWQARGIDEAEYQRLRKGTLPLFVKGITAV